MYIKVRVHARARREIIEKVKEDHFEIAVKEEAKRNMANQRVIELVARYFNVLIGKVRIINGHHSPSKILSVDIDMI